MIWLPLYYSSSSPAALRGHNSSHHTQGPSDHQRVRACHTPWVISLSPCHSSTSPVSAPQGRTRLK
uniref:Uncharacterized protein n=1 Tax=Zea mays TaxID=4577 RepID=C4IYQ9_MAIZE|nr:unknown [Zea mays]